MDASSMEQVVNLLWTWLAAGAVQRVGEVGANQTLSEAESLWAKIKGRRQERGLAELPASREELRDEVSQLCLEDPRAREQIQIINNHFHGKISSKYANFGIVNS
jgi:hypothetical protein